MDQKHYEIINASESYHWWYRVRRRLVSDLLFCYLARERASILDAGCGTGMLMKELQNYGDVWGVDYSEEAVLYAKQKGLVNIKQGNLKELPFSEKKFDVVLALDVLEHIEDDKAALREVFRVLKDGGLAVVFVPAFKFLWGVTDDVSHHFRRYTKKELREKSEQAGFIIERASYFNTFLFLPILLSRWFVRILNLPIANENLTGNGWLNKILFCVFSQEVPLLRHFSFPFGVSLLMVLRANKNILS